jgi:hypothetical protein
LPRAFGCVSDGGLKQGGILEETLTEVDMQLLPKAILQRPYGLGGGARLHAEFSGIKFSVRITPAENDALSALSKARRIDAATPVIDPLNGGVRSLAGIMELMGYTIEDDTLRQRISRMNVRFRKAAAAAVGVGVIADLVSTQRLLGYRLNIDFDTDDPNDFPRVKPPRRPPGGGPRGRAAQR